MHLRELGIRSAQGYVFAPPLPGSAFLQLVEAIDPLPAAAWTQVPAPRAATCRRAAFRRWLASTKKGGLAAAQFKRHAGGTS